MPDVNRPKSNIESMLEDYYDFERFFGDAVQEMNDDELEMLSAASGYAAFRDRLDAQGDDSSNL